MISPTKLRGLAEAFRCNPAGAAGMAMVWEILEECEVPKPKGWPFWSIPRQEQWLYRQLLSMAGWPELYLGVDTETSGGSTHVSRK